MACEAAKEVMDAAFESLVKESVDKPLFTSKSSDGTPMNVKHRGQVKFPSGMVSHVVGRASSEFLVKL